MTRVGTQRHRKKSVSVLRIHAISHTINYMLMSGNQQKFHSRLAEPNSDPPGSHR